VPGINNQRGTGIGIQNVKRRLALLYPNRHELKILDGEETFLVILSIQQTGTSAEKR
jgi:LytS/YehU family sensor histidine kinase